MVCKERSVRFCCLEHHSSEEGLLTPSGGLSFDPCVDIHLSSTQHDVHARTLHVQCLWGLLSVWPVLCGNASTGRDAPASQEGRAVAPGLLCVTDDSRSADRTVPWWREGGSKEAQGGPAVGTEPESLPSPRPQRAGGAPAGGSCSLCGEVPTVPRTCLHFV